MDKKTIFLDLDGSVFCQDNNETMRDMLSKKPQLLPGTLEKLDEWHRLGYNIILVTARPTGSRARTIEQLNEVGIYHYRHLLMGIDVGPRIMINDSREEGVDRAFAIPLKRNEGIGSIEL